MLAKRSTCIERLYNRDSNAQNSRHSYQCEIVPTSTKPDAARRRWHFISRNPTGLCRHLTKLHGKKRPGSQSKRKPTTSGQNRDNNRRFNISGRLTGTYFLDSDEVEEKTKPVGVLKTKCVQSESNKMRRGLKENKEKEVELQKTNDKKSLENVGNSRKNSGEEDYESVCRDMDEILYTLCKKYSQLKKCNQVPSDKVMPNLPHCSCLCGCRRFYSDNVSARIRHRYNMLNRSHFSNFNHLNSVTRRGDLTKNLAHIGTEREIDQGNNADKEWNPETMKDKDSSSSKSTTDGSHSFSSKDKENPTNIQQVPNASSFSNSETASHEKDKVKVDGNSDEDLDGIKIQNHNHHCVSFDDTLVTLDCRSAFTIFLDKENQREEISNSSGTDSGTGHKVPTVDNRHNRSDVFYQVKVVNGTYLISPRRCSDYDAVLSSLTARPDQETQSVEERHSSEPSQLREVEDKLGNSLEEIEFQPKRQEGRRKLSTFYIEPTIFEPSMLTTTEETEVETPEKRLEEFELQLNEYINPVSSSELIRLTEIYNVVDAHEKNLEENSKPKDTYNVRRKLSTLYIEPIHSRGLSNETEGHGVEILENDESSLKEKEELHPIENYDGRRKISTLYIERLETKTNSLEERSNFQPKKNYVSRENVENSLKNSGFQQKVLLDVGRKLTDISEKSKSTGRKSLNGETSGHFENSEKNQEPTTESFTSRFTGNDMDNTLTTIKENQVEEDKRTAENLVVSKNKDKMASALYKNSNCNEVEHKSTRTAPEAGKSAKYFKSEERSDKMTQCPIRVDKNTLVGESLNNLRPVLKVNFGEPLTKKTSDKEFMVDLDEADSESQMKYPQKPYGFRRDTPHPLTRADSKVTGTDQSRDIPLRTSTEAKKKKAFVRCINTLKRRFSKK